jgi:F-type H+-transporting ATPase subunit delta
MQGSSRAAAAAGQQAFDAALVARPDTERLAEDLFGVVAMLDGSAALRRALTDPTREAAAKADLVRQLLTGKVSDVARSLVATVAGQRWSDERDLSDTLEGLAVQAIAAGAESTRRTDQLEDELFRFERIVAADPALREAITDRHADPQARRALVERLLTGRAMPETIRLARQAAVSPRGRRFDRVIEHYLTTIADRRDQLSATVVASIDLSAAQRVRLSAALQRIYGRAVHLNVVVDPAVIGGIRVEVGDEVVDGTVLRKLDAARRHMGG